MLAEGTCYDPLYDASCLHGARRNKQRLRHDIDTSIIHASGIPPSAAAAKHITPELGVSQCTSSVALGLEVRESSDEDTKGATRH